MQRAVITGLGAITPIGIGVEAFWDALLRGVSGTRRITRFDTSQLPSGVGAEVLDFDPHRFMSPKEARQANRFMQMTVAAARMALEDSGLALPPAEPHRWGVVVGTAIGGLESLLEQQEVFQTRGLRRVSPYFLAQLCPNMAAAQVAIMFGLEGPNETVVTACASGTDAVGRAMELLQLGKADVVIAAGSDSFFVPLTLAGLARIGALASDEGDPARACRPFDRRRTGMVIGEGASAVVVETLDHALRREAPIRAELLGYASFGDGYHPTAPAPDARGEIRAMAQALAAARVDPQDVDYINAHGTGTPLGDLRETQAIKRVFGEHAYRIPVSSIKGATGHLVGAAGVAELIACVKAIETGLIPPTINYEEPDPECDLDYVPNQAREHRVDVALSNSFGFGGQNASVVVGRWKGNAGSHAD